MTQRSQRWPHCGVNQWRAPDGICKRCERSLDDAPQPPPATSETPAAGTTQPARLAVLGAVVIAVAVVVSLLLPRWLDSLGSPVSSWNQALSLTTIELPASWQHTRLDRGDLPYLFPLTDNNLQSIRGSFTSPRSEALTLVLRKVTL